MARLVYVRLLGAVAIGSFAFALLGAESFLSASPASSAVSEPIPQVTVNHFRKGDRLPVVQPTTARRDRTPLGQSQGKVPFGCDSAFSPVTSPELANLYGRCMA